MSIQSVQARMSGISKRLLARSSSLPMPEGAPTSSATMTTRTPTPTLIFVAVKAKDFT